MENVGREPTINHGSLHGPGYSGGSPLTGTYPLPGGGLNLAVGGSFPGAPDSTTTFPQTMTVDHVRVYAR